MAKAKDVKGRSGKKESPASLLKRLAWDPGKLGALLEKDPAGLETLDRACALARVFAAMDDDACERAQGLAFAIRLVAGGADVRGTDPDACETALGLAATLKDLALDAKLTLLGAMMARGAEPAAVAENGYDSALDRAARWAEPEVLRLLAATASQDGLRHAIAKVLKLVRPSNGRLERLDVLLCRLEDIDATASVARGARAPAAALPVLHLAVHAMDVAAVDLVLTRTRDPSSRTSREAALPVDGTVLKPRRTFDAGEVREVFVEAGTTPAALADAMRSLLESTSDPFDPATRDANLAALEEIRRRLIAAGGRVEAPTAVQPSFKATIDRLLLDFARRLGARADELEASLKARDARDLGPWTYLNAVFRESRSFAPAERSPRSLLERLAFQRLHDGAHPVLSRAEMNEDRTWLVDPSSYPEACRDGLAADVIVASQADGLYFLWPTRDGTTRVCHATPGEFRVLGETVEEFVRNELRALGEVR